MSITPQAIQDLLDELEASKQARLRAWAVLQRLRALLCDLGNVTIDPPSKKTFDLEGAILEQALKKCLSNRETALKDLADGPNESTKRHSVTRATSVKRTRLSLRRSIAQRIL
jgi:hypothetical protein